MMRLQCHHECTPAIYKCPSYTNSLTLNACTVSAFIIYPRSTRLKTDLLKLSTTWYGLAADLSMAELCKHSLICLQESCVSYTTPCPGKKTAPKQNAVKCTVYNIIQ